MSVVTAAKAPVTHTSQVVGSMLPNRAVTLPSRSSTPSPWPWLDLVALAHPVAQDTPFVGGSHPQPLLDDYHRTSRRTSMACHRVDRTLPERWHRGCHPRSGGHARPSGICSAQD